MKCLKNPIANAFYLALLTAVYATALIVSSEFTEKYATMLSNSQWATFIANGHTKYVGIYMICIAIVVNILSALRRKRYDEYQISILQKVLVFNGFLASILFPLTIVVLVFMPICFVEIIFAFMIIQWCIVIITEIVYLCRNY